MSATPQVLCGCEHLDMVKVKVKAMVMIMATVMVSFEVIFKA